MTTSSSVIGSPASTTSYEIDYVDRTYGEYEISFGLSQGGANDTFKGTRSSGIPYQQDRGFAAAIDRHLSEDDLRIACEAAAQAVAECLDGSTISVVALNVSGPVLVANVADSPVMAFVISAEGNVKGHYLIKDPHNARPKIPFDWQRVPAAYRDDKSLPYRFYDISVAHAVGDRLYPLSSQPDIQAYELEPLFEQAGAAGRVFLCAASDGICPPIKDGVAMLDDGEWVVHYASLIEHKLRNHDKPISSPQIVSWIMNEAIARRKSQDEQDNLLIQVTEIKPQRSQTLVLGICDGHRPADLEGSDFTGHCAQRAAEKLYECLTAS